MKCLNASVCEESLGKHMTKHSGERLKNATQDGQKELFAVLRMCFWINPNHAEFYRCLRGCTGDFSIVGSNQQLFEAASVVEE